MHLPYSCVVVLVYTGLLGTCVSVAQDDEGGHICNATDKHGNLEGAELSEHVPYLGVHLLQTQMQWRISSSTPHENVQHSPADMFCRVVIKKLRKPSPFLHGSTFPSLRVFAIEIILASLFSAFWLSQTRKQTRCIVGGGIGIGSFARSSSSTLTRESKPPELEAKPMEPKLLHHRISMVAKSDPSRVALIDGDVQESFGQLQASALYVARHLVEERGVRPSSRTPIGVCAEGTRMMHALLGIVHTGNPYVPLPPNLPAATRDFIVGDANIQVVLADHSSLSPGGAWEGRAEASPAHVLVNSLTDNWRPSWEVSEHDLAYVLYTSGSTGKPKGVRAAHSAYYNRLAWMWQTYPIKEGEVGIQKTAIGWVDHVQEVFGFLGGGAPLVLAPAHARTNPIQLINLCRDHRVSRLVLVPSLLHVILGALGKDLASDLPSIRFWITSGEPFPTDLLKALLKAAVPGSVVLNTYGTTEIAGDVSWAAYDSSSVLPDGPIVPVGRAIPPNVVHLLDPDTLQHVPAGEPGEIFVEGPHLAVGYHNRPEEDKARFVTLPDLGINRAFRTGDFGKLDQDQMIEFLGRKDQQVKVHGQRVELLQVEFELGEALVYCMQDGKSTTSIVKPACAVEAVQSRKDPGSYRLLAFVEMTNAQSHGSVIDQSLQQKLREKMQNALLPAHVPEAFISVKALPRLVNGKLDRVALKKQANESVLPEQDLIAFEERDSFGQIRRILAEYTAGRRVIGTMSTCALLVAILFHFLLPYLDKLPTAPMFMMDFCNTPRWVESFLWFIFNNHEVSVLVAAVGTLHGMGDQTRFNFSWWEPNFCLCWLLVHAAARTFARNHWAGYLYILPEIFLARIWAILWHRITRIFGLKECTANYCLSISAASCIWLLNQRLQWLTVLYWYIGCGSVQFWYELFSLGSIPVYLFGFYFGPQIVSAVQRRPLPGFGASMCLFIFSRAFTLPENTVDLVTLALTLALRVTQVAGVMGLFATLPEKLNLAMPGPAQMAAFVLFNFAIPLVWHGVAIAGVGLFPSLFDIIWRVGLLPSPVRGVCQIIAIFGYGSAYLLIVKWLYHLVVSFVRICI